MMVVLFWGAAVSAAAPPTDPVTPTDSTLPLASLPPTSTLPGTGAPLVIVPPGCASFPPALAVFRGTIVLADDPARPTTFRFRIDALLAGSLVEFARGGLVDVYFGDEAKLLTLGMQYVVGVQVDLDTDQLTSAVREAAPLFGGDAVIGANDSDVRCPRLQDPVRTLHVNGQSVDTGVLTPMKGQGRSLALAVLKPLAVAFAALLALVLMKHLLFAVGRSVRNVGDSTRPRPPATRRHAPESAQADQLRT